MTSEKAFDLLDIFGMTRSIYLKLRSLGVTSILQMCTNQGALSIYFPIELLNRLIHFGSQLLDGNLPNSISCEISMVLFELSTRNYIGLTMDGTFIKADREKESPSLIEIEDGVLYLNGYSFNEDPWEEFLDRYILLGNDYCHTTLISKLIGYQEKKGYDEISQKLVEMVIILLSMKRYSKQDLNSSIRVGLRNRTANSPARS